MVVFGWSIKTIARISALLILFLPILILAHHTLATVHTVIGTVTKVSDGDSIQITTPEQTNLKVRLYGIDAPETPKVNNRTGQINKPGQPYGQESRKVLSDKLMGKAVKVDIVEFDKYKRSVCMVWLDDRNINLEMIREGFAEVFIEYLKEPYKAEFLKVEREARAAKRKIWSLPDYERPREFRKRLKVSGD